MADLSTEITSKMKDLLTLQLRKNKLDVSFETDEESSDSANESN